MATVIFLRHGRTTANASGVLAGWSPDVHLDDDGQQAVKVAAEAIAECSTPVKIVASPLVRCQETAAPLAAILGIDVVTDDRIGECKYGAWTGRTLAELAGEPLWQTVQKHPSAATFPASDDFEAESVPAMQARAVAAVRELAAELDAQHGPASVGVVVSHGDVIKSLIADAYGAHLDSFQRIIIAPASISIVTYATDRPYVLTANASAKGLPRLHGSGATSGNDATVGGSSGTTGK